MSKAPLFRFVGSASALGRAPATWRALMERESPGDMSVRATTEAIIDRVRRNGDAALHDLSRELDGVDLESLEVPPKALRSALDGLAPSLRSALERAAANIAKVHSALRPQAAEVETEPGIVVGRRPDPLDKVGVYAPGGRGAYPSSVLMGAVPARVAGVATLILCSPPGVGGAPSAVVLAAARLAEVDRVFAIGGAGAIAAMAYGTGTVPRVSRIVGPGNAYVAEAKLQVQASGAVAIDSPAGPSELLVIADSSADPSIVAREMAAQAEHDPLAAVILMTDDAAFAQSVIAAITDSIGRLARAGIIADALRARGAVIWMPTLDEAVDLAREYAPEHLLLAGARAESLLPAIRSAGTVFVGETSSVAFGDYMTGANHVLPTGGTARCYSGLSTSDFIRWTTFQRVDRRAASSMAADVGLLADAEQLGAHAAAARSWEASS